jgi:hypothetical protein
MTLASKGVSLPLLGHVTLGGVIAGVIVGVILAPQVRRLPGVSKLPTL